VVAAPPPAFVPSVAPLDFDLNLSKPAPLAPAAAVGASLPPTQIKVPAPAQPVARAAVTNGSHSGPTAAAAKLDLHNDFDTAPGTLEVATARAPLTPDRDLAQPATLRAGLPGDSGFIEFDMSALTGLRGPGDTERARLEPLAEESQITPSEAAVSLFCLWGSPETRVGAHLARGTADGSRIIRYSKQGGNEHASDQARIGED